MSLAIPDHAPEPIALPEVTQAGVDAFVTSVILAACFHLLLGLYTAMHYSEPPEAWKNPPRPFTPIEAELVPAPPQPPEAIGEAMKAAEEKLPPVDTKLVNSLKGNAFKTLLTCRNCTLAGTDFKGSYLRLASLQHADLRKANLAGAELTGTLLSYANLKGADLRGANAAGVDLRGANLKGADLSYARLDAALVANADFTGARMVGTNLRLIEFVQGVTFRDADLRHAIFRYAHLRDIDFRGANLSGADFTRAQGLSNEQLALACGDEKTILPYGLHIPKCSEEPAE